ncbi:MAG: hypothetical protein HOL51_06275 [Gemmatimonadetes bacterium]|nr:hypothetical protein [Gemmatimonadota bacterium]MBT5447813.1 hypothetical protein [Gemmatimonadota bacterium]MBT5802804.1 hypothetical protein [Gemmatimonadota bacterium]MBT6621497.1 hypothetical protein [Gemmatimonadota bacterium]MBT6907656.1 hypothetical protein [Gemmatimonadota bacterium]
MAVVTGAPFSIWMVRSSEITWSYFPTSAGFCFVVIFLANALVRRWRERWMLQPGELATIVIMGLAATGIPTFIVGTLLAIISSPYYGATPENDWAGNIHPYLPEWIFPHDNSGDAMRWFYEGLPKGQTIPFDVWIGPLFWMLSLILTVYFVCFCMVVVFRRQWAVHERLVFPLMEMPRLLIDDGGRPIVRSKGFWLGVAIPLGMILFNLIGSFYIGFPKLEFTQAVTLQFSRDFPAISLMLYFPVIGFMYLVSTSVSFSIVFFYLLAVVQEGVTNRIGYDVTRPDAFVWGMQSLSWQAWGGFVAMVVVSLWMGRRHLGEVMRQVFRGQQTIDDSEEMVSYRTAVYGFLIGLVYILGWLWKSGMDLHIAVLFIFGVLVAYYGVTRLVVQAGVYFLGPPVGAQAFTLAITGTSIGGRNLVALGITYAWFGDVQSLFMPAAAHGARLAEIYRIRRSMAWALGLAAVVGFITCLYFVLSLCYQYGAGNFGSWYFVAGGGAGGMAYDGVIRHFNEPWPTDWNKLSYFGIGIVSYAVLAVLQYRFHWWPLHPIGITLAPLWMTRLIVFSIFLAWLCKSSIMRYGGISAYRDARPFFMGLIAGYFLGVGVSYLVDVFWFMGEGHPYFHG